MVYYVKNYCVKKRTPKTVTKADRRNLKSLRRLKKLSFEAYLYLKSQALKVILLQAKKS